MNGNFNLLWISANKSGFNPIKYGNCFEIKCKDFGEYKLERIEAWLNFHFPEETIEINNSIELIIHDL